MGVVLNHTMTLAEHVKHVRQKVFRTANGLRILAKVKNGPSARELLMLLKGVIYPMVT